MMPVHYVCRYTDDPDTPPQPIEKWPTYGIAQSRADIINASAQAPDHMVYVVPAALMWNHDTIKEDDRG